MSSDSDSGDSSDDFGPGPAVIRVVLPVDIAAQMGVAQANSPASLRTRLLTALFALRELTGDAIEIMGPSGTCIYRIDA